MTPETKAKVLAKAEFDEALYPLHPGEFRSNSLARLVGAKDENLRLRPLIRTLLEIVEERGKALATAHENACGCCDSSDEVKRHCEETLAATEVRLEALVRE